MQEKGVREKLAAAYFILRLNAFRKEAEPVGKFPSACGEKKEKWRGRRPIETTTFSMEKAIRKIKLKLKFNSHKVPTSMVLQKRSPS